MNIPGGVLHQSHIESYGAGALDLTVDEDRAGCPALFKAVYQDQVVEIRSPFAEYGTAVHEALRLVDEHQLPVDEALSRAWSAGLGPERWGEAIRDLRRFFEGSNDAVETIGTELYLEAFLYEDDEFGPIRIGGTLDRLGVDPSDPGVLVVDDYKTMRRPPKTSEMESWSQGLMYALLVTKNAERWGFDPGDVKVRARVVALKHGYVTQRLYLAHELERYEAWAQAIARKILRDDEAIPVLNNACGWCPARRDCPAWLSLPSEGDTLAERVAASSALDRIALRPEVLRTIKLLEKLKDDISDDAVQLAAKADDGVVTAGAVRVELDPDRKRRYVADTRKVHQIVGEQFYDIASVAVGKIEDVIEEHPEWGPQLEATIGSSPLGLGLKWGEA